MFRKRPEGSAATVWVTVEGREVQVPAGASAAAALLLAGLAATRETAVSGAARGPYCLMGVCFECLAEIDGVPNCQSCMVTIGPGMAIRRQHGKRIATPQ
ncbi:MAG: (2Fe-2S)-binding protein [Alphaproteobacteria bacterium]|nr:(2Fe-2S)-binding protein [Alphaproteobacteria bacterium]